MSGYLIMPLPKTAWKKGRIGPENLQDWFVAIKMAKDMLEIYKPSKVIVVSGLQVSGQNPEADNMVQALKELGVSNENIVIIKNGVETIGQINLARKYARSNGYKLVIISSWIHYPRVRWITKKMMGVKNLFAFGIPRPKEVLTDSILTFLFPIIDLLGLRKAFLDATTKRRLSGKL